MPHPMATAKTLRDAPGPYVRGLGCGGLCPPFAVQTLGFGGTKRGIRCPRVTNTDKHAAYDPSGTLRLNPPQSG
jgi:hypothetical protein